MTVLDAEIAALAKALAPSARLRIVRHLPATPGCIGGDIVKEAGPAQSTVSEHLRILKAARHITREIDGPQVCYPLNTSAPKPLADLITGPASPPDGGRCVPETASS